MILAFVLSTSIAGRKPIDHRIMRNKIKIKKTTLPVVVRKVYWANLPQRQLFAVPPVVDGR